MYLKQPCSIIELTLGHETVRQRESELRNLFKLFSERISNLLLVVDNGGLLNTGKVFPFKLRAAEVHQSIQGSNILIVKSFEKQWKCSRQLRDC